MSHHAAPTRSAPRTSWLRHGPKLFAVGVLVTAIVIVATVFAITGDPRAAVEGNRTARGTAAPPVAVADAAVGFVAGAKADVTSVTQYDYRSLDVALDTGLDVTTGRYRSAYRASLTGALARQARADRAVQTFAVAAAGIGTIAGDLRSANVMIFGTQTLTKGAGRPVETPVTLTASIVRRGDRYLIADLGLGTNPGLPTSSPAIAAAAEAARRQTVASLSTDGRSGRVTALAVESASARQIVVLVAGSSGTRDARLRVVVRLSGNEWRVVASQPAIS